MIPQTQFTPGPYTSDDDLILDSSDYVLAVVQPNENHEGNVALFRSAPSLYAALQAMLECAEIGDLESLANAAVNARKALDLVNA